MLNTFIDSLLPGARSVRPPLIAGMLWSLLFWVLLSPYIVQPADSEGWPEQFYAVIEELGPVTAFAVAGVFVFIIGAALTTVSDTFSLIVGSISKNIVSRWRWQRRARHTQRMLTNEISDGERNKRSLLKQIAEMQDAGKQATRLTNAVDRITSREKELRRQVALLTPNRFQLWVPPTSKARKIVGPAPKSAGEGLEREIVNQARSEGQDSVFARSAQPVDLESENKSQEWWDIQHSNGDELESLFLNELDPDPLLALRLIDEDLFLDLDRERAERELRLAVAAPLFALMITAAFLTPFLVMPLILSVIPLVMIVRYSVDQADERTKILKLLKLKGLSTPVLNKAFRVGTQDARLALAKWDIPIRGDGGGSINQGADTEA